MGISLGCVLSVLKTRNKVHLSAQSEMFNTGNYSLMLAVNLTLKSMKLSLKIRTFEPNGFDPSDHLHCLDKTRMSKRRIVTLQV